MMGLHDQFKAKASRTGSIKLPKKFFDMLCAASGGLVDSIVVGVSPDKDNFSIKNPLILTGWLSLKDYKREIKSYCRQVNEGVIEDYREFNNLFSLKITADGKIKLPDELVQFLGLKTGGEDIIISGSGDSFDIAPSYVEEEQSRAMSKWFDAQGLTSVFELLDRTNNVVKFMPPDPPVRPRQYYRHFQL